MLCKVAHCVGCISANARPRQLRCGGREVGTAISCTDYSQVVGLVQKSVFHSLKVPSFCVNNSVLSWLALPMLSLIPRPSITANVVEGLVKLIRRMTSGRRLGARHFRSVQKNAAVACLQLLNGPIEQPWWHSRVQRAGHSCTKATKATKAALTSFWWHKSMQCS